MAESFGAKIKKVVYGSRANIGKQVEKREGVVGKIAGTIEDVVEGAVNTGKQIHEQIQSKGGYRKALQRGGQTFIDSMKDAYNHVANTFFTDGKIDYEKTRKFFEESADPVRKLGEKAYKSLAELVAKGAETISRDYHQYIPTEEELNTTYKGIGTQYQGFLFREHFDKCLDFYGQAEIQLPKGARYKRKILDDIKASASSNKDELVEFYAAQIAKTKDRSVINKMMIADKYLHSPKD